MARRCCRALLMSLAAASSLVVIPNAFAQALAPGAVIGWGDNSEGQTTIPAGLNGVTSITRGGYHSLALKSDGTVVGWGNNFYGQTTIPPDLNGVTAIAGGGFRSLAANTTPVDRTAPTVTLVAPTQNAIYPIQQKVVANYTCTDPSTVTLCSGSVPVGALLDTSRLCTKTFTVTATDGRGNTGQTVINYTVQAKPMTLPPTQPPRRN